MNWRKWKIGAAVSLALSLFVAGAGLATGMDWRAFVAVFCAACVTHFGSYIKDHPVAEITFDTERIKRGRRNAEGGKTPSSEFRVPSSEFEKGEKPE